MSFGQYIDGSQDNSVSVTLRRKSLYGGLMTRKKGMPAWVMISCLFFLSLALSSCIEIGPSLAKETPQTSTGVVIYGSMTRNFTGTQGVLNIYVGYGVLPNSVNLALTPTPTPEGNKDQWTPTLWLVIVGKPDTATSEQIKTGQTITFEGFTIKVVRIAIDASGKAFVELDVSDSP
jgi:hypothetical protein